MTATANASRGFTPAGWVRFIILAFLIILGARTFVANYFPKIVYSESESLPHSLFIVDQAYGTVERGDYVTFLVPNNPYMSDVSVTKQVVGIEGDIVSVKDRWIYIGDKKIGLAKERTRSGEVLTPIEPVVIGRNQYFVAGTHKDSYDSRYRSFGLVHKSQIGGLAEPIF